MSTVGIEYIEGAVYLVAIQLLVIAVMNLFAGKKQNIILGFFLLVFVDTARSAFIYYHLNNEVLQVLIGNFHPNLTFGPLLYLYLRALTQPDLSHREILKHLALPLLIAISIPLYVLAYKEEFGQTYKNIFLYESRFIITAAYFMMGLRLIFNELKWSHVKQEKRYRAFFMLVGSYFLIGGIDSLLSKHFQFWRETGIPFHIDALIYLAVFIYLVFHGITELNWMKNKFVKSKTLVDPEVVSEMHGDLSERFDKLFSEGKIHTNPELNMAILADELQTNTSTLRDYLTVRVRKSFHTVINEKRVEEFKSNLFSKDYEHLDLTGIAYASGFSSKATFNRAFKKIEGITPREFREKSTLK